MKACPRRRDRAREKSDVYLSHPSHCPAYPWNFPFSDPKVMPSAIFWCLCDSCHGKPVSRTTWYDHNPVKRRRTYKATPKAAITSIGNPLSTAYIPPRNVGGKKLVETKGPSDRVADAARPHKVSVIH